MEWDPNSFLQKIIKQKNIMHSHFYFNKLFAIFYLQMEHFRQSVMEVDSDFYPELMNSKCGLKALLLSK